MNFRSRSSEEASIKFIAPHFPFTLQQFPIRFDECRWFVGQRVVNGPLQTLQDHHHDEWDDGRPSVHPFVRPPSPATQNKRENNLPNMFASLTSKYLFIGGPLSLLLSFLDSRKLDSLSRSRSLSRLSGDDGQHAPWKRNRTERGRKKCNSGHGTGAANFKVP